MSDDHGTGAPMFVHSDVDDLGLDVYAFRVYATIWRRYSAKRPVFYESIPKMAERLGISAPRARQAMRELERRRLIVGERRTGQTTEYHLTPRSMWAHASTPTLHVGVGTEPSDTPTPHVGVPRHHMSPTPTPGVAKGTPLSSSKEGTPLSLRASSETGAARPEPSAANAAERETQPPSRKGGQSRAKGRSKAKGKGPHEGEVEASRSDYRAYREAWNEHRGNLAECSGIDARRRAWIDAHEHEHGADALTMFTNAARNVATDPTWFAKNYAFDELFKFGCIVEHHEKWNSGQGMSAGDRKLAWTTKVFADALAPDDRAARDAKAEAFWADPAPAPDYPDVTPAELLEPSTVEGGWGKPPHAGPKPEPARFAKGDRVRHPEFGDVTVIVPADGPFNQVVVERDDGFTERVRAAELVRLRRPPTGPRPADVDAYIRSKRTEPEPELEREPEPAPEAAPDLDAEPFTLAAAAPARPPAPLTNGQPSAPRRTPSKQLTEAERADREQARRAELAEQAARLEGTKT